MLQAAINHGHAVRRRRINGHLNSFVPQSRHPYANNMPSYLSSLDVRFQDRNAVQDVERPKVWPGCFAEYHG